jgi:hypothetical protein
LWFTQVQENEKQFEDAVANLQQYELALLRALGDVEKVEQQSGQIKETYMQSIADIGSIND